MVGYDLPVNMSELMERLGVTVGGIRHPLPRACAATKDILGTPAVSYLPQKPQCFACLFISPASRGFWLTAGVARVPGGERDKQGLDLRGGHSFP